MSIAWISDDFFDGFVYHEDVLDTQYAWERPYEYHLHAEYILNKKCSDFELSDAMTSLKRAINLRLENLNSTYRFKHTPYLTKKSGLIEIMSGYGLIRPLMVKKLNEVRNLIEHQYKHPSDQGRCEEFLEFTWYFLKTTDVLARGPIKSVVYDQFYEDPKSHLGYHASFDFQPEERWRITLCSTMHPESVSFEERVNWIKVDGDIDTFESIARQRNLAEDKIGSFMEGRSPEDYLINAKLVSLTTDQSSKLISQYFSFCQQRL